MRRQRRTPRGGSERQQAAGEEASHDERFSHFEKTIDSVRDLIEGDDGTEVNPLRSRKPRQLQRQLMCVLFHPSAPECEGIEHRAA